MFFLHIPKTAGTSLRSYLRNQYRPEDVLPAGTWPELVRAGLPPSRYRLVQGHYFYNMRQALPAGTPAIAILREPLTRTLSGLRHLQRDPHFHLLHAQAAGRSIRELLRDRTIMSSQANVQAAALCASAPPDDVIRYLNKTLSTRPSAEASDLEIAPTLDLALQRLEIIEFPGVMDDLSTLITQVSTAMAYHPVPQLPSTNAATGSLTTLDELDPEDIAILREHNQLDLVIYDRAVHFSAMLATKRTVLAMAADVVHRCPSGDFEIDLLGPVPGSGWYEVEHHGDAVWRWTGPEPHSTLDLILPLGLAYRAEMHFRAATAAQLCTLALRINGAPAAIDIDSNGDGVAVGWTISAASTMRHGGFCQIMIDVGATERSGNDLRRLGIAVSKLAFKPVAAELN